MAGGMNTSRKGTVQEWARKLGTAVAILLFGWLLSRLDWGELWEGIGQLSLLAILLAELCFLGGQFLNTMRWWILLRAQHLAVHPFALFKLVMSGAFASNFLPSTVGGDIVRVAGVTRYTRSEGLSLGSVIVDRLVNVFTTVMLFPFVILIFGDSILQLFRADRGDVLFSTVAGGLWTRLKMRIRDSLRDAAEASRIWLRSPLGLLEAMLMSTASTLIVYVGVFLLARTIGIPVDFLDVLAISVTTYVITLLPISINGYGLREVAVTVLYVELGATLEQASLLAVLLRMLRLMETLPGALWISSYLSAEEKGQIPVAKSDAAASNGEGQQERL